MLSDASLLVTAIPDLLLTTAALGVAGLLSVRKERVFPSRPLATFLATLALGVGSHALTPVLGGPFVLIAGAVSAVLAWIVFARLLCQRQTEKTQSEPEVDETTRLLETALSVCGDGVMIASANADSDGVQIVYSNPAFERLTGYTTDEAVGLSPSILADEPDGLAAIREAVRGSDPVRVELPGRRKDGSRVWAEWQIVPVADTEGKHVHSVAVLRDVTDRRRAERALRDSESRFRGLFEQAADAILVLDHNGRIIDANRQACFILGHTQSELVTLNAGDLGITGDGAEPGVGNTSTVECSLRQKDGQSLPVEIRYAVIDAGGRWMRLAFVRDVSRRRRAEQALREREELLRDVIAHIPCGVFWKDRNSIYLGCNDQVARDHGFTSPDQLCGRSDFQIRSQQEEATFYRECDVQVMESGLPILNLEEHQTRPDGTRATLLTSKVPLRDSRRQVVGVLGVYQDISDRKRLEEQFRQAQKMEAVGRLAGGIAHDFNNLLTIIRGNAELLRPSFEDAGSSLIDDLILAADRATALIRQLLMFSRRQPARVEVLDLNEVVTALSGLLRRVLGSRVVVETTLAPLPVTVRADRSHLEQVVMNLAVNARDAMPSGGTLTVGTAIEDSATEGKPRFARLTITDTGTGMTEEVKARVFEPFFTTKGPDKGTGLGLATVFGIVQQAGGQIEVVSNPGMGTTFRVALPWCEGEPANLSRTPIALSAPSRGGKRGVAVLLVEDQDAVRKFAERTLKQRGHEVSEAESGEAALEILKGGQQFDVLVTDVTMPGIDGRELAAHVRGLHPGVGVVLMSGYAPDADHIEPIDRSVFVPKPFPPGDLISALDKALKLVGYPPQPVGCFSPSPPSPLTASAITRS